ncbi:Oxygen-evolving enhancer protein 1, chloroplastic [Symbiodinium microadriaticum]|uniref:Oxygen-evolving enhancer protein 1, chloroplastic n=1 Tax=Symbiodinium microadriaticum TaxID=2951 RepID=A0A1Q9C9R6_SYMMI|nr:Oxygen-evolving enhancer protein 1, chloroplastic [Symbiodinium microadriaticum]
MVRNSFAVTAVAVLAVVGVGSCFLTGLPQGSQPPRAAPNAVEHEMPQPSMAGNSWAAPLLSFGAALGLIFGVVAAKPARAITAEQFSQLTYAQVKGSGLANRCPTVESNGTEVPVKGGSRLVNVCFEPKSFAVEFETDKGKEFATTKLTTRQTYTLAFIEGSLDANPITFKEQDGMDFAATTVKLPDGEYVPFLFTVKELVAKGEGSSFKPGFTWGGEFSVPSYRTGGFLDPKGRGMTLGYDQAVALPAMQSDGQGGQDELFKETNKVFDLGKGVIEMEIAAMGRHSSALLKAAVVACALLALNQLAFVAPGSSPKLRGQEAAVAGAVLAGLPAAPALATDQASDAFSQQDAILIFIPILFVWVLFLDWDSKQPSADDVTGYGALGPTVDGPSPDQPAYFRRSPENG